MTLNGKLPLSGQGQLTNTAPVTETGYADRATGHKHSGSCVDKDFDRDELSVLKILLTM